MRRPLKPFVTEYKGPGRRQKDGAASAFGTETETPWVETAERKAGKPSEPKKAVAKAPPMRRGDAPRDTGWTHDPGRFNGGQNEDSYEAAMRAADALFSGAPTRRTDNPDFAPVTEAAHAPKPQEPTGTTASGSGRILRVIDEDPAPELAALEAERMPKRRGRKPGSKNKPKAGATIGQDAIAKPAVAPKTDWTALFDESDEDGIVPEPIKPIPPSRPFVIPTLLSRGEARFAWVRTKLGPGESWKRRLPKILW